MAERSSPRIQAGGRMKEMMSVYYLEAKNAADNGQKVAWITSGGPVELLIAMDVIPVYPENHAAMCGAARMGVELSEIAEQMGYSRDLCSYALCDIGSAVSGKSPIMGLPKPDFLLCCNHCGTMTKWYEVLARMFDVPLILVDIPFIHDELTENAVRYIKRQFARAIEQMESILGRKFDMDRFAEVATCSTKAANLWGETLGMCKNVPSPMSGFDGFILMAAIVTLRGRQEVVDFYETLKKEIEDRVANGVAAVPGEKYRLLWDNLPIWFKMRDLSRKFVDLKACIVASTYLNTWAATEFGGKDLLDPLARAYATIYMNTGIQHRAKLIREIVEQFSIEGIIFLSNRSCKPYSLGQYDIKEMLVEWTGVPGILIEADMNDERAYAEAPVYTRIEAFIETLQPQRNGVA
jgi:benzoyl-CoA reductase/2-hydroxyglutaryl-CoA dehydratase subunit BcrC/BadD/HgdB